MTTLRIGTRGSDLALAQTRWVCDRLRSIHPSLAVEEVIIKTHGDLATEQSFDGDWPAGGFTSAIEQALLAGRVDLAVHSYKDLPTAATPGLVVAAVPQREVVHDVLVTREVVDLDNLRPGFRLGTSSPRRAAQFRRIAEVEVVPLRGNVPTRLAKIDSENLDGIVLAAAGLKRLGIDPPNRLELPVDRFVPAPAQGALAVQTQDGGIAVKLVKVLDHDASRRRVDAERAFLRAVSAGCHTPVAALASVEGTSITLHGQLFGKDVRQMVEGMETGEDPAEVGAALAERLLRKWSGLSNNF